MKVIEMVLCADDTPDRHTWSQVGRVDSGVSRVSFRSSAPAAGDPPQRQADLIRKAAARGSSVVIVEPSPDPKVAEALDELKKRGTAVLLLARPVPGRDKDFPLVTLSSPADAARSLVKAAVEDAAIAKLPADGTALIINSNQPDVYTEERVAAFKAALKDAGVGLAGVVTHDGSQADANKLVRERLKSDPKITLVFSEDGEGLFGAITAREKVKDEHPIIVAGYAELGSQLNQAVLDQAAAIVDRNIAQMAHVAFRLAMLMSAGKPVDGRTELPTPFHRYASKPAPLPITPDVKPSEATLKPG